MALSLIMELRYVLSLTLTEYSTVANQRRLSIKREYGLQHRESVVMTDVVSTA